uniref:Shugoshin_C domain-containing protein n=1 Tax=Haemonchus contortus TaxID=6289 RepID=A0A7I4YE17_HAECO|nr:Shugoshin domain containing protein [Haemonchus contortus]
MSEGVTKNDLAAFFGTKTWNSEQDSLFKTLTDQNIKGMTRDYYAKTNQSLVRKIRRLEDELSQNRKVVEELRNENAMLKKRLAESEDLGSPGIIEALVDERIKKKIDRLNFISRRAIAVLNRSASELKNVFEDFGVELLPEANGLFEGVCDKRLKLLSDTKPPLAPVSESPPLVIRQETICERVANRENDIETPVATHMAKRSRRSELFGRCDNVRIQGFDEDSSPQQCDDLSCPGRNVDSVATPLVLAKRTGLDTPAVERMETDTVRRKRTATLKIKTLAEPKLNCKLRRPGPNDEPHPFILLKNNN